MAASLWLRHGLCRDASIFSLNCFSKHLRVYSSGLKRRPVRVLSISEANELAERPRRPSDHQSQSAAASQRHRSKAPNPKKCPAKTNSFQADKPIRNIESGKSFKKLDDNVKKIGGVVRNSGGGMKGHGLASVKDLVENSERSHEIQFKQRRTRFDLSKELAERVVIPENVKYETLATGDSRFGPLVMEAKLPKSDITRKSTILLEGKRLVSEGVAASLRMTSLFFTDVQLLAGLPLEHLTETGTKLYRVSAKHMKVWSDTVAPSGLMAICSLPAVTNSTKESRLPVTIICDRIEDPGCLGTVLRAAAAAACSKILVTRGCTDPWTPKVLRAGMGAHFYIPVMNVEWEFILNYLPSDARTFLVSNRMPNDEKRALNIPRSVLHKAMVAGGDEAKRDMSRKHIKLFETLRLPSQSYEAVDYYGNGGQEVALVVGDKDTPSPEAKLFAYTRGAELLYVPGAYEINHAVVSSVILFEILRQFRSKTNCSGGNDV